MEQPVDLDDGDDVFNYPWLYAVEVGYWNLTDEQVKKFREYLLRGGFFMCDDFHGTQEWAGFVATMSRVFPDRPIVEIPNDDPIFHVLFDLTDRYSGARPAVRVFAPSCRERRLRGGVARDL